MHLLMVALWRKLVHLIDVNIMLHTCLPHAHTHLYALVPYHIYSHQFVNTMYLKGHYHCFTIAIALYLYVGNMLCIHPILLLEAAPMCVYLCIQCIESTFHQQRMY